MAKAGHKAYMPRGFHPPGPMRVRLVLAVAGLLMGVPLAVILVLGLEDPRVLVSLPYLTARSLSRMTLAYLLSLGFSLLYGYTAAVSRRAGRILIPLLDILQSIPILGFLPAAIFVFATNLPGIVGYEVASIFLIFTSMSWNIAFGVYESISGIPKDLDEASRAFNVGGWLRFRRLTLPSTIPRLVYNSMLSWTNGWFFVVASEILINGQGSSLPLPGLGTFLGQASGQTGRPARYDLLLLGLLALVLTVLAIDAFLWRPLQVWSDKFKMEYGAGEERRAARFPLYIRLTWLPTMPRLRRTGQALWSPLARKYLTVAARFEGFYHRHMLAFRVIQYLDLALALTILGLLGYTAVRDVGLPFVRAPPPEVHVLWLALVLSLSRLALGYTICLAWTIPAAYFVATSPRAYRVMTPLLEVAGSIPAPALLPLLVATVLGAGGTTDSIAVVMTVIAMQWYLLFNLLGAFRAIPGDLREASEAFNLTGWLRWKRLLLPAIFPSLVTGSITAWGAGWNALIVSEFVNDRTFAFGLGYLLDKGTFAADPDLILLSVGTMVAAVVALNYLLWKPLYRLAASRFKVE